MITQYLESMFQDLSEAMKKELGITPTMEKEIESYPLVTMQCEGDYVRRLGLAQYNTVDANGIPHTYDIDYRETMLIWLRPQIVVAVTEIQQLIDIENFVTKTYSAPRNLFVAHPNIEGERLPFQVSIDTTQEIQRNQINDREPHLYGSFIPLKASNGVSFYKPIHPAQLAFDEKLKADLLQRIAVIGDYWNCLNWALEKLTEKYQYANLQDKGLREEIRASGNTTHLWRQMEKYPQLNAQDLFVQMASDRRDLWKIYSDLMEQTQILPKELWEADQCSLVSSIARIQQKEKCDVNTAIQSAIAKNKALEESLKGLLSHFSSQAEDDF